MVLNFPGCPPIKFVFSIAKWERLRAGPSIGEIWPLIWNGFLNVKCNSEHFWKSSSSGSTYRMSQCKLFEMSRSVIWVSLEDFLNIIWRNITVQFSNSQNWVVGGFNRTVAGNSTGTRNSFSIQKTARIFSLIQVPNICFSFQHTFCCNYTLAWFLFWKVPRTTKLVSGSYRYTNRKGWEPPNAPNVTWVM